ncbi:MAG: sigma-54 dependent transcriptional regulator, partial [Acidobacteria bacterium]|nr:sigma-54 dependent transcriptional regulator [Acidobacteriota bacterium]
AGDGLGVLRAVRTIDPELQVVVMTADSGIHDVVAAMKAGALDVLVKPVDPGGVLLIVERAVAQRRMQAEDARRDQELAERRGAPRVVGKDPQLLRVSQQLGKAARTNATVLLEGESGTGKELFARGLHALSPRVDGPFVAINCAAIPEGLLETELFGHEKGAFTGAIGTKSGRFEMADRGTLFLDEIGDMPLPLQAKILRALEEKAFERVGSTSSSHVDVRVVAATNRDLKARVAAQQFREDLYFRLSVFPIRIPPLRDRTGDAVILARHFIQQFCRDLTKETLHLSPSAVEALETHRWPGNVRELQNCIERAVILCDDGTIERRHLSLSADQPVGPGSRKSASADQPTRAPSPTSPLAELDLSGTMTAAVRRVTAVVERLKLEQALKDADGDRERAAQALHISYKALLKKQREYGIDG